MAAPELSNAEWTVMETLWDAAPQTASEVARTLRKKTGWADNTVRTLLTRLVEKGAVRVVEPEAGARQFEAAVRREVLVKAEGQSFMQRVFGGAAKPLIAHFAETSKLTPEDVRELKRLLDQTIKNQK